MALTDNVKVDRLFKWMFSRARGDNSAAFFEEAIPTSYEVHAADVFVETIPGIPPTETNSVIQKLYPAGEDGDGWIEMTCDRKYNGNRVWVALDTHESTWSSGSGDVSRIRKNFINPKYGSSYVVKVFDGNDNAIPELDNSNWLFDYRAGVLTFESDRAEAGSTPASSIKIKVFQYVGQTLATASPNTNGGSAAAMKRGGMIGTVDGTNKDFFLPSDTNTDLLYLPKLNGQDVYPGADYTVDSTDPLLLHMVGSPDPGDRVDVVYYPK